MFAPVARLLLVLAGLALTVRAGDLDREIILVPPSGTEREDQEIRRWQARVQRPAAGAVDFERLAWSYLAKARRTLDAGFHKLAEKTVDVLEAEYGVTAESRLLRGNILHNLHHFGQAEVLARGLVEERGAPADFALLSDTLVDQGKLNEAVEALQRLENLKPGIEADSRISYLRWLKGDLRGATAAMESAARAASPQDGEPYAWVLARLSGLYLQGGESPRALQLAEAAGRFLPAFPPALLARGRALLALGESAAAISALQRAAELNPLPEYQWWLADALRAEGRNEAAERIEADLKAHGAAADPRTYALFLASRGIDPGQARLLAEEELATRGDVLTHDAVAWARFAGGDLAAAAPEMAKALREHTEDGRLLWHAGEIARATGQPAEAASYFHRAHAFQGSLLPSERARLQAALAAPLARAD